MTDEPTREELVEQAEKVLELVKATIYQVADGEAYRLQQMLKAKQGQDND